MLIPSFKVGLCYFLSYFMILYLDDYSIPLLLKFAFFNKTPSPENLSKLFLHKNIIPLLMLSYSFIKLCLKLRFIFFFLYFLFLLLLFLFLFFVLLFATFLVIWLAPTFNRWLWSATRNPFRELIPPSTSQFTSRS